MNQFIRTGTIAAILGGLLLATGAALVLLPPAYETFSAEVVSAEFAISSALRLAGAVLMTWGLIAIYLPQADQTGKLGIFAVVACLLNLVLQMGWMFTDLFTAPILATHAPQVLDGGDIGRLGTAFMAAWLANTSFVLLGIASLRAKVLSKVVGISLIVAGGITLVPLPVDGPVYEIIIGISYAVAGACALSGPVGTPTVTRRTASQPTPQS